MCTWWKPAASPRCVHLRVHAHVWCGCVPRMCKTNLKTGGSDVKTEGTPPTNGSAEWAGTPLHPLSPHSSPPSALPSLDPSSSSLGHWGEWTAILILIPLSLCGPRAERGDRSPGLWNAPALSSGHWWRVKARRGGEEGRGET